KESVSPARAALRAHRGRRRPGGPGPRHTGPGRLVTANAGSTIPTAAFSPVQVQSRAARGGKVEQVRGARGVPRPRVHLLTPFPRPWGARRNGQTGPGEFCLTARSHPPRALQARGRVPTLAGAEQVQQFRTVG